MVIGEILYFLSFQWTTSKILLSKRKMSVLSEHNEQYEMLFQNDPLGSGTNVTLLQELIDKLTLLPVK